MGIMHAITRISWLFLSLNLAFCAQGLTQAPPLKGPYSLGTTVLEVIDPTTSRDLMLSVFYPTANSTNNSEFPLAAVFPPLTAPYIAESFASGTSLNASALAPLLANLTSRSHLNSPILTHSSQSPFPILLFSPGYGASRLAYTCTAEEIASLGYIVLTIDHPNDASVIEYLNGTIALTPVVDFENYTAPIPWVNARVQDMRFALDSLSNYSFVSEIPGIAASYSGLALQTRKIGAFGHSMGGAATFSSMLVDSRFVCGVNMDGALYGNVSTIGLTSPTLIMGNELHNRSNNPTVAEPSSSDPTWTEFWNSTQGWKRMVQVNGTVHLSFSDGLIWADVLGIQSMGNVSELVGTIAGERMLDLERAYIGEFFGKWFKDERASILDGPSKAWPEVWFDF